MRKILLLFFAFLSIVLLVGCGKDVTETYNGNKVVKVETAFLDHYVEVTELEQQEKVLSHLSELDYSEYIESDSHSNSYSLRLTYDDGSGVTFYFDFENNTYSIVPFDSKGNTLYEESKLYSGSEEEMEQFRKMYD